MSATAPAMPSAAATAAAPTASRWMSRTTPPVVTPVALHTPVSRCRWTTEEATSPSS